MLKDIRAGWIARLHILTLSSFAFVQPLYDLLGKTPEFFTVRNQGASDVAVFMLILNLLLPLALVVLGELGRFFNNYIWKVTHSTILFILFLLIGLQVNNLIFEAYDAIVIILSTLIATAAIALYWRQPNFVTFISYLTPAILIFPLLFIFDSPVFHIMTRPAIPEGVTDNNKTPIVILMFDELPISTLMSAEDKIDSALFPNFDRLAKKSTWYINASTVAEYTHDAVPAFLTGRAPDQRNDDAERTETIKEWLGQPSFSGHPHNLFTALADTHDIRSYEVTTSLCPIEICSGQYDRLPSLKTRVEQLIIDLSVVYLHIILPEEMRKTLPRVDMNWTDFINDNIEDIRNHQNTDKKDIEYFLGLIDDDDEGVFYYLHTTLPHSPWVYLPDGRLYQPRSMADQLDAALHWQNSEVRIPYQRHLLQTMYADKVLGQTIDKLNEVGLFDKAVIIVTSDHGASFGPGEPFRNATRSNIIDIANIPLFVKPPKQSTGFIDTRFIRSIDIIPLLFEYLDATYPWKIDGSHPEEIIDHEQTRIIDVDGNSHSIDYDPNTRTTTIERKAELFGTRGLDGLFGAGKFAHLIGKPLSGDCSGIRYPINPASAIEAFENVDTSSFLPAHLSFDRPKKMFAPNEAIMITLNGKVTAVLPPSSISATDSASLEVILDYRQFIDGKNSIELRVIDISENCA